METKKSPIIFHYKFISPVCSGLFRLDFKGFFLLLTVNFGEY